MDEEALIALGANLPSAAGAPAEALRAATARLEAIFGPARRSRIWATPAWPAGAGPDYANAAIAVPAGGRTPEEVLALLHEVEAAFGRARGARWAARTLDLDLIGQGDAVRGGAAGAWAEDAEGGEGGLVLPHPRMRARAFVLLPLAEVAPGWRHPALGLTVLQMLAALPEAERAAARPL